MGMKSRTARENRCKIRFKRSIPSRNGEAYADGSNRNCEDRIHGHPFFRKAFAPAMPNQATRCLIVLQLFAETDNLIA
jgi:hypothetical protein